MGVCHVCKSYNGISYQVYRCSSGYLFVIPGKFVSDIFDTYEDCIRFAQQFIDYL